MNRSPLTVWTRLSSTARRGVGALYYMTAGHLLSAPELRNAGCILHHGCDAMGNLWRLTDFGAEVYRAAGKPDIDSPKGAGS